MIVLLGTLTWLCAIAFVLALCRAAKDGDRALRRNLAVERATRPTAHARRERVTVGS
jgi:hypothetical protein